MAFELNQIPSPNHSSRAGATPSGAVFHYTGAGSHRGTIRWFQMPESEVSAHVVIARDGDATQMVPFGRAAWHAGRSEMMHDGEMCSGANRFTIGIELANCGLLVEEGGKLWWEMGRTLKRYRGPAPVDATLRYDTGAELKGLWEPYPDVQLDALQAVLRYISMQGYQAAAGNPVGHEEIAMPFAMRKRDPGPAFPWDRFSRKLPQRTSALLS